MECKDKDEEAVLPWKNRFNRNIVECKVVIGQENYCYESVLIETLWNVKLKTFVEHFDGDLVLIETLWNVKAGYLQNWQPDTPF